VGFLFRKPFYLFYSIVFVLSKLNNLVVHKARTLLCCIWAHKKRVESRSRAERRKTRWSSYLR